VDTDPLSEMRMCLESQAASIVGSNWALALDESLLENLGKYRKYDVSSVRDCLRVIRNKKNHYADLPLAVKQSLGPLPEGFLKYFSSRFPALLVYVYSVLACFALESPASSPSDPCSYSPLDLDGGADGFSQLALDAAHLAHSQGNTGWSDSRMEAVQQFYHRPLSMYPALKFSSPQLGQFYSAISLRRLVQLQKHTRLRFRHWYLPSDKWELGGKVPPPTASPGEEGPATEVPWGDEEEEGGAAPPAAPATAP
jgi:hypothetical protein